MEKPLAPWRRSINILDVDVDEQIKKAGHDAGLMSENGYSKWDKDAERLLILAKWGIIGITLANSIRNIKGLKNEK